MRRRATAGPPPIDLAILRRWIGDDPRQTREMLHAFVRLNAPLLDELRVPGAARARGRVRELAHQLRGSAAMAGATALAASLAGLEDAARGADAAAIARGLRQVLDRFGVARAWIEREYPEPPPER